jgi:hypothetical protein
MIPTETVAAFDAYLQGRGLVLEAVVVGGTALGLLGDISSHTLAGLGGKAPVDPTVLRAGAYPSGSAVRIYCWQQ